MKDLLNFLPSQIWYKVVTVHVHQYTAAHSLWITMLERNLYCEIDLPIYTLVPD